MSSPPNVSHAKAAPTTRKKALSVASNAPEESICQKTVLAASYAKVGAVAESRERCLVFIPASIDLITSPVPPPFYFTQPESSATQGRQIVPPATIQMDGSLRTRERTNVSIAGRVSLPTTPQTAAKPAGLAAIASEATTNAHCATHPLA